MSSQNVTVARFARNVEWDFFCDFQTPCDLDYNHVSSSQSAPFNLWIFVFANFLTILKNKTSLAVFNHCANYLFLSAMLLSPLWTARVPQLLERLISWSKTTDLHLAKQIRQELFFLKRSNVIWWNWMFWNPIITNLENYKHF